MVLTVGDDDDGLPHPFPGSKAACGHVDGCLDIGTLTFDERGVDGLEKHLGRDEVIGNGQLDIGLTSKYDKSYLVVGEAIDKLGDHVLGFLQAAGRHILGKHGVGDIERNDSLDSLALDGLHLGAKLRTCQYQHHEAQGHEGEPELQRWA